MIRTSKQNWRLGWLLGILVLSHPCLAQDSERFPETNKLIEKARTAFSERKFGDAVEFYIQASDLEPKDEPLLYVVIKVARIHARSLYRAGNTKQSAEAYLGAVRQCRQLLQLAGNTLSDDEQTLVAESIFAQACAHAILGNPKQAIVSLKEAFDAGLLDVNAVESSSHLRSVRALPEFPEFRQTQLKRPNVQAHLLVQRAVALNRQLRYGDASKLVQQAVALYKEFYPKDKYPRGHSKLAVGLYVLGNLTESQGKYTEAQELFEEVLEMQQRLYPRSAYPRGHRKFARTMRSLGQVLQSKGEYAEARKRIEQALAMYRRLYPVSEYPNGHTDLAGGLFSLGSVLERQGNYSQAREVKEQTLAMHRQLYPLDRHPNGHKNIADSLASLAFVLRMQAEYSQAIDLYEQALQMRQHLFPVSKYPDGHPHLAASFRNLGTVFQDRANYKKARVFLEKSLQMRKRLYPTVKYPYGHPELAHSLNGLGLLLEKVGDYSMARKFYEQALHMRQRLYPLSQFPNGHPSLAASFGNLSSLLHTMGDFGEACKLGKEALRMTRLHFPSSIYKNGHPTIAGRLSRLGSLLFSQGNLSDAQDHLEMALSMRRQLFSIEQYPKGHPHLVVSFRNLGGLNQAQGKLDNALQAYSEALRIYPTWEYPRGDPMILSSLGNIGSVLVAKGDYAAAKTYFARSRRMGERLYPSSQFPNGHPGMVPTKINQAWLFVVQGDHDLARESRAEATAIYQHFATRYFASASEVESLNYIAQQPLVLDSLLSIGLKCKGSAEEIYEFVWKQRGSVQRAIALRQRVLASIGSSRIREMHAAYLENRRDLSQLMLAPASGDSTTDQERLKRLRKLGKSKERRERELANEIPEFRNQLDQSLRPHQELVKKLNSRQIVVDCLRYVRSEHDPKIPGMKGVHAEFAYVAFVLQNGKPVTRVELGLAEPIETAVTKWRESLGQSSVVARQLRQLVWEPIEKVFRKNVVGIRTVYVSPDGSLTGLPWSALPKAEGGLLIEDYQFAVLSHAQFLLDSFESRANVHRQKNLLIVGDVHYDRLPKGDEDATSDSDTMFLSPTRDGKSGAHWSKLPATRVEVQDLVSVAPVRTIVKLSGQEATTSRVLAELPNSRWAHFATHGFFADAQFRSSVRMQQENFAKRMFLHASERKTIGGRNPLTLSGLVLAGANVPRKVDSLGIPRGDDGILTAEAISGMNLLGLELAVLSACETGLGDVAGGEGVYGLQRAFHTAGTRNVIATLWNVNDQASAVLMRLFYHKLWVEKKPPIEALREAQLIIYRNPRLIGKLAAARGPDFAKTVQRLTAEHNQSSTPKSDTKHWAGFVLSGPGLN